MKAFQVEILKMLDSPCHLNMEIDLDEIIHRFARLHLRDLRRMELTNFNDTLVSSTLILSVNIFTWKKEKSCSPGVQNRTRNPPNTRSDVLTTELPGF